MASFVVDYEKMADEAKRMRGQAQEINSEISTVYQEITDMHSSWYGNRYNELVKSFNEIIPSVNQLLNLIVTEIPSALETVANNYSTADRGTAVTSVNTEAPQKIGDIPVINDVGMHFVTSEVSSVQSNVVSKFQSAINTMDVYQSEFNSIQWSGSAADGFRNRLSVSKNDVTSSFNSLSSQFTKLMNQTKEDIQATENANTVQ